jgi:sarcosine oxidase
MTRTYDVIVIGLGGMGSAAAYQLARRGERVLGLERFTPAHDQGSSHGRSRLIRQAYFEDPAYVPMLLRAYELWEQIEQDSGEQILTVTGGLMLGPTESRTVTGSLASARKWGLEYELLNATDIRRRFPTLSPGSDIVALYEKKAGFVRPEASVSAYLQRAEAAGGNLHFSEPVLKWEVRSSGEGVRVTTAQGIYEAERLVITPGAWAPELLADLGLPLEIQRQVLYWFMPTGGNEPFWVDRHPVYIWEAEDGVQFYGFPAHDDPQAGAKVAFFRLGTRCTPETIDRTVHPEEVEVMRSYLRGRIPQLGGTLVEAKTCMYTNTPDQHFIISLHPQYPQVAIAAGFSGHGFKFVSLVGEILADLATEGSTKHPIALFDPKRLRE